MADFQIRQGRDIKLKGAADKQIVELSAPQRVAVQPQDYRGLRLRLSVKEGDPVKRGSILLTDKNLPEIKILSPISGKIAAINRGAKRALMEVVIEANGSDDAETFELFKKDEIENITREDVIKVLLDGGLWPAIRQRPFSRVANPYNKPKSIFVHAMNTEPLAPDVDFVLNGQEEYFQIGLNILKTLTDGKLHLCAAKGAQSKALTDSKGVEMHRFSGAHPAGNVSTHIHYIDPINKGDVVWYVQAQDVLSIARLFTQGLYPIERIVAVTGEGAQKRVYAKTMVGAPISLLLQGSNLEGMRCISGSILTGTNVGKDGFVCFYDAQVTIIPEGGDREFLGWLSPGFNKYTLSKTYASAFVSEKEVSLDTDENGGHRAIVLNHIYDSLVALDIYTYFLLKAVIAEDLDQAERLGILECDEEDFALCTFACPSKTDVGAIIRQGLDLIEKEG